MTMSSKQFNLLLRDFLKRTPLSNKAVAAQAGIASRTLQNWISKKNPSLPNDWTQVAAVARVLQLDERETDQLLAAIRQPTSVSELKQSVTEKNDIKLLGYWCGPFLADPKPAPFIGRIDLLAKIEAALVAGSAERICVLHGMGGVGKTTLSTQLAHTLRDHFTDGVLRAKLPHAPMQGNPSLRAELTLFATVLKEAPPATFSLSALSEYVRHLLLDRNVLLILDNVTSEEQIELFRPAVWSGALLVTTRQNKFLTLPSHTQLFHVPPFDPATDDALQLLRVQLKNREWVDQEEAAFRAICEQVGYLPIALKIIAADLLEEPNQPAEAYLEELRQNPTQLFEEAGLNTLFDVSYERLPPFEQAGFVALGAFNGHAFSQDVAAAILQRSLPATKRFLRRLQRRSLLEKRADARHQLHPLLNQFARTLLIEAEPYRLKSAYYTAYLREQQHQYGHLSAEAVNLLQNLADAHHWQFVDDLVEGVVRLHGYLIANGLHAALTHHLQNSLAALRGEDAQRATLLAIHGLLAARRGEDAEIYLAEAFALATRLGNVRALLLVAKARGGAAMRGDRAIVQQQWEHGLQLATQLGDMYEEVVFHHNLASLWMREGARESAELHINAGLDRAQQLDNPRLHGALLNQYAAYLLDGGDFQQASAVYQRSLQLARQQNDPERSVAALLNLSHTTYLQGDYRKAVDYAEIGLGAAERIYAHDQKLYLLANLLEILIAQRRFADAETVAKRGMVALDHSDHGDAQAVFLTDHAQLLIKRRISLAQIQTYLLQAAHHNPSTRHTITLQLAFGAYYLLDNQLASAQTAYMTALTLAEQTNIWHLKVEAHFGLVQTAQRQNDATTAQQHHASCRRLLANHTYHRKRLILEML